MNMKKINILVIPAWFDHEKNSSGIFIHEFCELLNQDKRIGISVLYLHFFSFRELFPFWFKKPPINDTNYNVIYVKIFNLKSKLFFFLTNQFILKQYTNKVLNKIKPSNIKFDVIHIQSVCNNVTPYVAEQISDNLKLPLVLTEHYTSFKEAKGGIFKPYLTEENVFKVVKSAAVRAGVSDFASELFQNYFDCKFQKIYNIINNDFFTPKESNLKNSNFTFISIGKLDQRKGFLELLIAFEKLYKQNNNLKLVIIGEGDLKDVMKSYIQQHDLTNNVFIYNWMKKNEIIEQLDMSHVLISASEMETFGLTIVEALLRGLPVIATKSGGPMELINKNNGLLIELQSKEIGLYSAMLNLMTNYQTYNFDQIKSDAIKKFNNQKVIDEYFKIYSTVSYA